MMKFQLLIIILIMTISINAQVSTLEPSINSNDPDLPEWVQLMYSNNPNVWEVEEAYKNYYQFNNFVKNTYTQYYKRWRQRINPFITKDGFIRFPTADEISNKEKNSLELNYTGSLNKTNGTNWEFIGPSEVYNLKSDVGGGTQYPVSWHTNIYSVDIAKSNTNILYAGGESGGLFKTVDKGKNWKLVNQNILSTRGIRGVKIHPTNPDIVYFNASGNVYKTTDGGISWSKTGSASFQRLDIIIHDMEINATNPDMVYFASNQGFYRTIDGGVSWTRIISNECWTVAIKPNDPNVIYTVRDYANTSQFCKSTDAGESFQAKLDGWYVPESASGQKVYGVRITVTEADPDRIYALIGDESKDLNGYAGVFVSTNAGESWTHPHVKIGKPYDFYSHPNLMANNGTDGFYQGFYDFAIIASPEDPEKIIIGGTSWWRSDDGGKTYKPLGGYVGTLKWSHPDMQSLCAIGNELWIASDGGLTYSTDFATTHESRNKGITGHQFWGFGSGWNEDVLVGGRYHNGNAAYYQTYDKGKFLRMGGAEEATGYVSFGESRKTFFSDIGGKILPEQFDSQEKNFPVGKFPNESYWFAESSEMEFDPRCWNVIYIGSENGFWKSDDGGTSFTLIKSFGSSTDEVREFEICRSNPDVIYIISTNGSYNSKLWKTIDGGVTWKLLSNSPINFTAKTSITVSAEDENVLWVSNWWGDAGKQVWKSSDGGASWKNISTAKLNGFRISSIVHQYGTDGGIYLGTDAGTVFYRNNKMSNWEVFGTDLPVSATTLKLRPFYKKGKIRNGTWNYGIWETDFYEPSKPIAQIAVDKFVSYSVQDTFYFNDHSVVKDDGKKYQWSFPEGTPSTSNIRNPKVTYSKPGSYSVELTVTDIYGTNTQHIENIIEIKQEGAGTSAEPISGNALSLNGSSDYAVANTPLNLKSNNVTITGWIKRNGTQSDFAGIVFSRGGNTTAGLSITKSNELRYHWNDKGWWFASGLIVPDNVWTHIALVVEPSKVTIYMNGNSKPDNTTNSIEEFDTPLYIGSDPTGGRLFKGLIDEVCVFNKALSKNEIRESMHLTKNPDENEYLVAYYQFNEEGGKVFDKVGLRPASMGGTAKRVVSNGPFGGGTSQLLVANVSGKINSSVTGIEMSFPDNGKTPDGDIVITKIDQTPNISPDAELAGNYYWIIDNYGNNFTFDPLKEIKFSGIGAIDNSVSSFDLFQRNSLEDIGWGNSIATSNLFSANENGFVTFGEDNNISKFGQFLLSININTDIEENLDIPNEYSLSQNFPNPFNPSATIRFSIPNDCLVSLKVYNELGQKIDTVLDKEMTAGTHLVRWNAKNKASGVYFYRLKAGSFVSTKKMILLR